MKYRVIKNFGCATKGDVLENSKELPTIYTMESNKETSFRSMALSEDLVNFYTKKGLLEEVAEACCEESVKLDKVTKFVEDKLVQYRDDYNDMLEAYNNQEVPECAKVEAETVYYNMNKLLNKVKELLNE